MATMTAQGTLPAAGNDMVAAPITDTFNHIINTYNGNNIDENNVDYSSADGVMVLAQAQTRTAALILTSTFTVGVDDTGHDVKFFGATSGKSFLWDESLDQLTITGKQTISETLGVTGVATFTAQTVHSGGIQSGGNIVSDTNSTDDLGSTSVRWANLYVDDITLTTTITAGTSVVANTMTLATGSITDTTGAISFGNENLTTTGTLNAGATTVSSLTTGGTIVSDTTNTDDIGTSSVFFRTGYFQSGWQHPLRIGACRLWEDATNGRLMYKYNSDPVSETDGNEFMVG